MVGAGEFFFEEEVEGFFVKFMPGLVFGAGDDGVEEGIIVAGGAAVAGGVADYEDAVGWVFAKSSEGEVLGFRAHFLAGDDVGAGGEVMFAPFAGEGIGGGLGDDDDVGVGGDFFEGWEDPGERGDVVDHVGDGVVDGEAPF